MLTKRLGGAMAIRVLLVERVTLLAEAMKAVLTEAEIDVVETFSSPRETIAFLERDQPDVIVMNLDLMDDLPIETIMKRRPFGARPDDWVGTGRLILKRWPDARILLLSSWEDPQVADRALRGGFWGFLTRGSILTELVGAIQTIADGQKVLSRGLPPPPTMPPRTTRTFRI
jgi:DNA-binding NarL/FixJ family response regulator